MFIAFTGARSDAAIVMSTLILASMFTPIKNALQLAVDKRFKEVADPVAELSAFNKQAQAVFEVIDTRQLMQSLLQRATDAMGANGGAIYLGEHGQMSVAYTAGDWEGEIEIGLPIKNKGLKIGLLALGPRRNGTGYSDKDRALLEQEVDLVAEAVALVGGKINLA